jgi:epoxyqueuosine reductase
VSRLITKRLCRHISQEVCPWNVKFSRELGEDSPFAPREFISDKNAVTLARDVLAMEQDAYGAAFRKSPMKRAKLAGLRRNASVVLMNLGTSER